MFMATTSYSKIKREKWRGGYYLTVRNQNGSVVMRERWLKKVSYINNKGKVVEAKFTKSFAQNNIDNQKINHINPLKRRTNYARVTAVYNFDSTRKPYGQSKNFSYIVEGYFKGKFVYGQSDNFRIANSTIGFAKNQAWQRFYGAIAGVFLNIDSGNVKQGKDFFEDKEFVINEGVVYYKGRD